MDSLYPFADWTEIDGTRVRVVSLAPLAPTEVEGARRVLLLHGNPSNLDHFRALVPGLRRRAALIAYDHPGFGRSDDFAYGEATLERSAALGLALLDARGVEGPVDVIGHSHGGMVAVAMAALAPARIRSLALLGTGGTPAHGTYRLLRAVPGLAAALPALAARLYRARGLGALARATTAFGARTSFAPGRPPAWFADEETEDLRARPETLGAMVRLTLDDPCAKVASYARGVRAPVLLVHASDDALVDIAYARRLFGILRRAAPSARFVEITGGHMAHLTSPARVASLLDDWLADRR